MCKQEEKHPLLLAGPCDPVCMLPPRQHLRVVSGNDVAQFVTPLRRTVLSLHPVRMVVMAFGTVILVGTTLLALPVSSEDGTSAPLLTCCASRCPPGGCPA